MATEKSFNVAFTVSELRALRAAMDLSIASVRRKVNAEVDDGIKAAYSTRMAELQRLSDRLIQSEI